MKTKALLPVVVVLLFAACASQPARFAGRAPEVIGGSAEAVWNAQLARKDSQRWHHNYAVVRAARGGALVETARTDKAARVGEFLFAGTRVRTSDAAMTDLFLGENGPVLRLAENSTVKLVRLDMWRQGKERIVDTMIDVEEGKVLGNVKKLAAESSYLLRTRQGVIRIRGTEFEVAADGTVLDRSRRRAGVCRQRIGVGDGRRKV